MMTLLFHLHFWTLRALSPRTASGSDIGTHTYHDKTVGLKDESDVYRREWAEGRGVTWTPRNRKPEKLRDSLKECEELLSAHRPICMKWKTPRHCLVLLDNGALLTFVVAKHCGDVERVMVDRTLVSKLQTSADNALIVDSSIILTLTEDRRPVYVSLSSRRSSATPVPLTLTHSDSGRKMEKLSSHDPRLSLVDVDGMPTGLVERHLTVNSQRELVAVWWRDTQDSGWQWSSLADSGLHNIVVFRVTSGKMEYACGIQTEYDPVDVRFSKCRNHILFTLEKVNRSTYNSCIYEYSDRKLSRVFTETKITSEAHILVCERNKDETKLLLGCEDGTLILHDNSPQGSVQTAKAYFSPVSMIRWHPAGSFAFVCSPKGELQCFDLGLSPLLFQLVAEDPSPTSILQLGIHFMAPVRLELAGWGSEPQEGVGHGGCHDNFIMVFDRGPVVLMRLELGVLSQGKLGPLELVSEHIRHGQLAEAVVLLGNMSWNFQPRECFACLTFIMDHLLTQPLTRERETQMELTLATFLAPRRPLMRQVQATYRGHLSHLSRRFFQLLLRYRRLEKAFRLALDIAAKDLFMDIHFVALDCNDTRLAEEAKLKAESISSGDILTDSLQTGVLLDEDLGSLSTDLFPPRLLFESDNVQSFDSAHDGYSPHLEQATAFHSSTGEDSATASEGEYSDNETTQEAT